MTGLAQDFRFALRQLRKSPGFVTLGIGVNTAIFNVIEAVVLRPLPFVDADRLVWLNGKMPQTDDAGVSPADFLDYRDANRSFEQMAGISQSVMAGPSNLAGDKPEQVTTSLVSAGFFQTLGVPLLLGRDFQKSDEQANTSQVVILGNGIWKHTAGWTKPDRDWCAADRYCPDQPGADMAADTAFAFSDAFAGWPLPKSDRAT